MADSLVFYTNPMSRGQIVRWMLEETGVAYETKVLDYAEAMKAPAYLAINPMGKVPAIAHNGQVITECAAICAYLADAFPDAGLAPPAHERAAYYRWLFFGAGPVEQAVTNKAMGFGPSEQQSRMAGYGSYDLTVDVLEKAVTAQPYVAGADFSAADVYIGSQIGWGMEFGTLPKRAAFEHYWAKLSARPAYLRAKAIDNALIAGAPVAA
ncbi:MAG: glutathione S-transferase family protein [Sphingomonas sp.]